MKNENIDYCFIVISFITNKSLFITKNFEKKGETYLVLSVLFHLIYHPFNNAILINYFFFCLDLILKRVKDKGDNCSSADKI